MKNIFTVIFFLIFLMLTVPAHAQGDTLFTVYGRGYDTDGVTPLDGITVTLTIGSSSTSAITNNGTLANGTAVIGYYYFPVLPSGATTGTSMTISASTTGKSVSSTVARAASEPQKVDLTLSTGSSGTTSSPGGGGCGGGGGGTSGENFTNIVSRESREEIIVKDLPISYNFTTTEFPVYGIEIISFFNSGLIKIQIELLKGTSTLVNESAPPTVYKNVNIWVGTSGFATPNNIKEATIKFKVENSWLGNAGLKDADIVMFRWDGTKWLPLETLVKKNEGDFTHFEAKTNAFSPFAISAIKGGAPVTTPTTQITPTTTTGTATPAITTKAPSTSDRGFMIPLIIILLLVGVYLYYRNTHKK